MENVILKLGEYIISAIVGIIVIKFVPNIQHFYTKYSATYRDETYKEASFKFENKTGLMTYNLIVGIITNSLIIVCIVFYLFIKNLKDRYNNIVNGEIVVSPKNLTSELVSLKGQFILLDISFYLFIVVIIVFIILIVWKQTKNETIQRIINEFEYKLILLKPDIGDKQVSIFQRKWSLIKNYHDYEILMSEMDAELKKYSL